MTVAQMEKEFIIKDGEQKHFMRLKINKEFSRQLIGHFLREVNQQMSLEEKTKEFHKGVQIVNNRFCNLYGKFAETEWGMFYASIVVPIKIGLGLAEPQITNDSMVNKYNVDAELTIEEKEAIISCGVCRLNLTMASLKRHLSTFCLPTDENNIISFATYEYFNGNFDYDKKEYIYDIICGLHNYFVDNSEIIERTLKKNGGILTMREKEK